MDKFNNARYRTFVEILNSWHEKQKHINALSDELEEEAESALFDKISNEMLTAVAELFETEVSSILSEECFWLEWVATNECYSYVRGLVAGYDEGYALAEHRMGYKKLKENQYIVDVLAPVEEVYKMLTSIARKGATREAFLSQDEIGMVRTKLLEAANMALHN